MNSWKRIALLPLLLVVIAQSLGGCACLWPSTPTYSVSDPPALSPYNQPLLGPQIEPIPEPGGLMDAPTLGPGFEQPLPDPGTLETPTPAEEDFQGPSIVPFGETLDETPAAEIELDVSHAATQQVGETVTFTVEIRNNSSAVLDEVIVSCEFDDALVFPGREEKLVQQNLGGLGAGQSREIALSLVSREAGRHCAYFAVRTRDEELAWKSACVQFAPAGQGTNRPPRWRWSWWGR